MIAVGCPVKNRAWSLPSWFDYVEAAFCEIGEEPHYVFVEGTSVDGTREVLAERALTHVIHSDEEPEIGVQRQWNAMRYHQMVAARNQLLGLVRDLQPDYFLSLDSDIMLNPQALVDMLETSADADAVGGKVYLVPPPETMAPSYANLTKWNTLARNDRLVGPAKVDVIMAIKLMKPAAYNVDYRAQYHGEDIGWSMAAHEAGLTLMYDGRSTSKHVMSPELLDIVDTRVGY